MELVGKDGKKVYFSAVFLCCPAGQGKSRLLVRFGVQILGTNLNGFHPGSSIEEAILCLNKTWGFWLPRMKHWCGKIWAANTFINLKSSDTWVTEYRKWLDLTGHGMPYYFGHRSLLQSANITVAEAAPAGLVAAAASSYPARGSIGAMFARDPTNCYSQHVVHCKSCLQVLSHFWKFQKIGVVLGALSTAVAIILSTVAW